MDRVHALDLFPRDKRADAEPLAAEEVIELVGAGVLGRLGVLRGDLEIRKLEGAMLQHQIAAPHPLRQVDAENLRAVAGPPDQDHRFAAQWNHEIEAPITPAEHGAVVLWPDDLGLGESIARAVEDLALNHGTNGVCLG